MRNRLWNNLADIRFRACYAHAYSSFLRFCGGAYSFILSFASAASVATWAIWARYPSVWASIVAIAQVLHIAKPHLGFLKSEPEVLSMSFELEQLYLAYERLWNDCEHKIISESSAEERFYELREKEIDIDRMYRSATVLTFGFLVSAAYKDTLSALSRNFGVEMKDDR